jgi:SAM-dependent methyltransferase
MIPRHENRFHSGMIAEQAAIRRSVVVDSQLAILRDLDVPVTESCRILDFGCGEGHTVAGYRALGYNAFGCDVIPVLGEHLCTMRGGLIPFPDNMFDVVVSEQVFEHVMDYDKAVSEIHRVLKPGGVAIHDFPSRWRPIEPHVWVPLACFIRSRPWLGFWALCGIRNSFQRGSSWRDVAHRNRE